ncbi:hypothetical protein DFH27DRAFT_529523 [Peziza echinospora]|nr:hypothetical protein DFH27DRAFT_529523 [Peziza echinospora]
MEWSTMDCTRKRHMSDDMAEEQPLSKKLSLLNLCNGQEYLARKRRKPSNYCPPSIAQYTPPPTQPQVHSFPEPTQTAAVPPVPQQEYEVRQIHTPQQPQQPAQERMDVDNVVYISDLETDSSDSDSEGKLHFLPEFQKKLSQIPYNIANSSTSRPTQPSTSMDLILYKVPTSISLPSDKGNVRRAIIEAREKARRKQIEEKEAEERQAEMARNPGWNPGFPPVDVRMILTGVPSGWEDKQAYLIGGYYGGAVPMQQQQQQQQQQMGGFGNMAQQFSTSSSLPPRVQELQYDDDDDNMMDVE